MAELTARYPLVRHRRRRRWRLRRVVAMPSPMRLAAGAVLLAAALLAGLALRSPHADPRQALDDGLVALHEGRLADARALLRTAAAVVPGDAQVALARVAIEGEDGGAAMIALQRAEAAGVPRARLHQLRAAALLLGDDPDGAIAEADRAAPAYRGFAQRVRARSLAAQDDPAAAEVLLTALVAAMPRNAGARVDLARVRLAQGNVGGAGVAIGAALALDRTAPAALALQGEIVRSRYGPVAATAWFAAALSRDPDFYPALLSQAAALGETGRAREALAEARAALRLRPAARQPRYLLAVLAARAGDVGLSRRLLQTMDDAADAVPGALLLGGWLAQAEGHDELAAAKWQQLLDAQPMNVAVRRLLGIVLLRSGDAQGALDTLAPLVARGDADGEVLEVAGRAARRLGDPRAATLHDRAIGGGRDASAPFASDDLLATLAAGAVADPDNPLATVALVRGLLASGNLANGVSIAAELARASPGTAAAQLVLGDALAAAGQPADAAALYRRAADLGFDQPTMLRLVDALGRAGRPAEAAEAVTLYLAQNPLDLAGRRLAGHWQAAAGDARAVGTLDALRREVGNRDAGLLADLAIAWTQAGDTARAVRFAAAAYRLAPMNRQLVQLYAAALGRAGNREGARQLTVKAAALATNGG